MERLSDLARCLHAELRGNDVAFTRVTTDTRRLAPGDLFVAIKGERFDGHDFVRQAAALGAAGALVTRHVDCELPQVIVPDALCALQDYAAAWRMRFRLPVVAVTGSNGKTTVKQMLSAVLSARGAVLATEGNLNNHIGVPLTLLALRESHRYAVIEMGANHAGEIARLAELARPDAGVVTNAADAHLEGFGSRKGVARAKGELFAALGRKSNESNAALGAQGTAAINADDDYAPLWRSLAQPARVITFGVARPADVRAERIESDAARTRFRLCTPAGDAPIVLPLPGRHNVLNALAAAAVAVALGFALADIVGGLARVAAAPGRLAALTAAGGAKVIDDSYNANPASLRAGLEFLASLPGRHWLALGDMRELGADAAALHREAGRIARQLGVERLFALGSLAAEAAAAFGAGGQAFASAEDLAHALSAQWAADVTVLVKGSRASRMERVVALLAPAAGAGSGGEH